MIVIIGGDGDGVGVSLTFVCEFVFRVLCVKGFFEIFEDAIHL